MAIGIPANIMILFVTTLHTKTKKIPSTIFMTNFAIADLVVLLFRSISVDSLLKSGLNLGNIVSVGTLVLS